MHSYMTGASPIILASQLMVLASGGLFLYVWIFYPLLLAILPVRRVGRRLRNAKVSDGAPMVSVVIAAYNEESAIESRIENFLATEYSGEAELLIVSDGSTDRTAAIASKYAFDRVRTLEEPVNRGKSAALALAVPRARGEILVFSDATSIFAPNTLSELVQPFADPAVGLVTGRVEVKGCDVAGVYRRYEEMVERFEERGGVISTAHGCVYAMRRSLWHRHDPRLTNDFFHPISVNLQGYDAVVAPAAVCVEAYSSDAGVQFRRQVRMVALAAFVYFKYVPVLLCARRWRSLFVLTSHKMLRWLTVVYLMIGGIGLVGLAGSGLISRVIVGAEAVFVLAVILGAMVKRLGIRSRVSVASEFVTLNWAGALGVLGACWGRVPITWRTSSSATSSVSSVR